VSLSDESLGSGIDLVPSALKLDKLGTDGRDALDDGHVVHDLKYAPTLLIALVEANLKLGHYRSSTGKIFVDRRWISLFSGGEISSCQGFFDVARIHSAVIGALISDLEAQTQICP
jgi:hypothetical protein